MEKRLKLGLVFMLSFLLAGCTGKTEATLEISEQDKLNENEDYIESLYGNVDAYTETDIVILMDESGSMLKSDKGRIAIEAAKMLIDMEKVTGANVALVEFSNNAGSTGLIELKQEKNREYLKSVLDNISYIADADTDTGAGLKEAVEVLDGSTSSSKKAIILFTDGVTDVGNIPNRTLEQSEADIATAIQEASEKGYVIYCVGLNSDGSVDEGQLKDISLATGGQYHIAQDVNELPSFFNQIFMDIGNIYENTLSEFEANGDFQNIEFEIANSNVMEANIVILSSMQIEDVTLVNPQNTEIDLENDSNIIFSTSEKYSIVKIIEPEQGAWNIAVKGVTGDKIKVSLLYNYNVSMMVSVSPETVNIGETVTLNAYLTNEGNKIEEQAFYDGIEAYANVKNLNDGTVSKIDLISSADGMQASFAADAVTDYEINVHMEGNGFYRNSEVFTVNVKSEPLIQTKEFSDQKIVVNQSKKYDLNSYFSDPNNEKINYQIEYDTAILESNIDDNILTLTGLNKGNTQLKIIATSESGDILSQEFSVESESFLKLVFPFLICSLVVILLIVIMLWRKISKQTIDGSFEIEIESVSKTEDGYNNDRMDKFELLNDIQAKSIGSHKFSLFSMLKIAEQYYENSFGYDKEKVNLLKEMLNIIEVETKKVIFIGSKKSFQFWVISKASEKVILKNGVNSISQSKKMEIALSDQVYGISNNTLKKFAIKIELNDKDNYVLVNVTYKMI